MTNEEWINDLAREIAYRVAEALQAARHGQPEPSPAQPNGSLVTLGPNAGTHYHEPIPSPAEYRRLRQLADRLNPEPRTAGLPNRGKP